MASPISVAVFGSTGLTGSHILSSLLAAESSWNPVHTISRRAPKAQGPNLNAVVEADTEKWSASLKGLPTTPSVQQWKIDHDLNVELAKTAKEAGVKTFVFISSAGTRGLLSNYVPYSQMKVGVEDAVKGLEFDHSIIVRPGMLLGAREEQRFVEKGAQSIVSGLGLVHKGLKNALGQDVDVIARATTKAIKLANEGKAPSKHWVLEGADILKLGAEE
uniref:NAD(P)-binding domain-containing protein n=1 Tax=Bionectria ochroleuca TaxID=29856 RepID=A0A0B7KHM9_BIOOC